MDPPSPRSPWCALCLELLSVINPEPEMVRVSSSARREGQWRERRGGARMIRASIELTKEGPDEGSPVS
jgi:hypothetical protein